jgi:hypothetical protein
MTIDDKIVIRRPHILRYASKPHDAVRYRVSAALAFCLPSDIEEIAGIEDIVKIAIIITR